MGGDYETDRAYIRELEHRAVYYQSLVFAIVRRMHEFRHAERIILDQILGPVPEQGEKLPPDAISASQESLKFSR